MPAKVFDLFDEIPAHVEADFLRRARVCRHGAGGLIYSQGDTGASLFRVVSGEVRLSVARGDGRELYYVFLGPGDCFGEVNFVDGLARPQTAQAVTDVSLQALGGPAIEALLDEHPTFNRALMRLLANHMRLLIDLCADACLSDLAGRVARRIILAVPVESRSEPQGRWAVNLSQSDLAHLVGASRQSVNKVLQQFQDQQILTTEYGSVVVESPQRLCRHAFPDGLSAT